MCPGEQLPRDRAGGEPGRGQGVHRRGDPQLGGGGLTDNCPGPPQVQGSEGVEIIGKCQSHGQNMMQRSCYGKL